MARAHAPGLVPAVAVLLLCSCPAWSAIYTQTADYTIYQINHDLGGQLRVYDKVFSNFSATPTHLGQGVAPDDTAIAVTGVWIDNNDNGLKDADDEYGLRFSGLWSAISGQLADTTILYKVTADDPFRLTDNSLAGNVYAAGGGLATIDEFVYDQDLLVSSIADKHLYWIDPQHKQETAHVDYGGQYQQLWISTDVGANGGTQTGGYASISLFYETFSQVPEPATAGILLLGAALLLRRRR